MVQNFRVFYFVQITVLIFIVEHDHGVPLLLTHVAILKNLPLVTEIQGKIVFCTSGKTEFGMMQLASYNGIVTEIAAVM